jgi:GTPase SAR1 family protein
VLFLIVRFCLFLFLAADTTAQEERLSAEKAFNKAVENEGTSLNSSRLCLVGQGRAGKTALANALINKEFKHTDSTVGVSQRFLEVDKLDLAAGDSSQWNVLGEDKRFVMSQEEALALQAAKMKFLEESTISLSEETQVKMLQKRQGTENINVAELLTDEVRDDEDDNRRELQHSSREGGRDVSAQDAIHTETANTLDSKTSFGGYSSQAAVGCIQNLPASYQSESPGNTPLKKDFSSSMEEVIKRMNMELPDLRAGKKEPLRISLWDYGGQDKFIGMHHLYLSRYCVFLLVFNMKWLLPDACEKDECLEYLTAWLNSISMHAVDRKDKSQAPILIIGTHKDEVPSPEDHSNISKILDDKFSYHHAWATVQEFKKAQGKEGHGIRLSFFPVDNTRGHQDDVLKQMQSEVLKVVEREKYVKRKVYYTWLAAYKTLQEESKTKPFLKFEKVKDICSASGMGTHLELNHETDIMLKFFHQMGLIMYHDEKALKHLVILDPAKFLVEPASRVVCQIDIGESASFAPDEKRRVLMRKLKSQKPHQYDDLRKGILHRQILWEFLWSDVVDNRDELEVLMTKYQLMVPLANKDGNEDRFLVPGLLPERQTNQVDDHRARLVGYFIFGHMEIMQGYRKEGYVSVDKVKREGFLPKGLFAAVLGSIVQECEVFHNMSFKDDMEMTLSSISTGFRRHKFVLRQVPEYNMMELIVMVDSPLFIVERLLELMQGAVSKLMPSLRFAICIDQEGGVCRDGQVTTPKGTDSLVILDSHETVKNDDRKHIQEQRLDGKNSLEQRLGAKKDIKVAEGHCLPAPKARQKFRQWLIPSGLRESYHVFLSYRWGDFDSELVKALFCKLCTEVIGDGKQVHVFLDRHRLEKGKKFDGDFAKSLINSHVVVPVVSYAALDRMLVLKPDSNVDHVLLEWMLIVELLRRGHLKFCYPIIAGEVKEDAKDGKFILNLFAVPALGLKWKEVGFEKPSSGTEIKDEHLAATLQNCKNQVEFKKEEWEKFQVADLSSNSYIKAGERYFQPAIETPCIDKLPEVVCTQVTRRVNELLEENGMEPSEFVRTYTVRGVVKELVAYNGFLAWEANALPMEQRQSKQHVHIDWKKRLYKLAADGVLEQVEDVLEKARQKEEADQKAAEQARQEAAKREQEEADQKAAEQARQEAAKREQEEETARRRREAEEASKVQEEGARRVREEEAERRNREEEEERVQAREEEEARQKTEADQKAAQQDAGKRLLPL